MEFEADNFAVDIGYGEELLSALYKLYHMEISDKKPLMERMKADHLKIEFRIENIENKLEVIYNKDIEIKEDND